jgi:hypothetical protein
MARVRADDDRRHRARAVLDAALIGEPTRTELAIKGAEGKRLTYKIPRSQKAA